MSIRNALQTYLADKGYGQYPPERRLSGPGYSKFGDYLLRAILLLVVLPIVLVGGGILIWGASYMIWHLTFGN